MLQAIFAKDHHSQKPTSMNLTYHSKFTFEMDFYVSLPNYLRYSNLVFSVGGQLYQIPRKLYCATLESDDKDLLYNDEYFKSGCLKCNLSSQCLSCFDEYEVNGTVCQQKNIDNLTCHSTCETGHCLEPNNSKKCVSCKPKTILQDDGSCSESVEETISSCSGTTY